MAKNYSQMATDIIKEIGGEDNVSSLTHCMTRLRFKVKDEAKVNVEALKKVTGVIQLMISGGQYQVVIGTDVADVYDEIGNQTSINLSDSVGENGEDNSSKEKKSFVSVAIDTISGIFLPFIGAFMAAGLLKGLLVLFTTTGIMSDASTTYQILYAMGDGIFTFLPIFLAYTAAKKFGAEPFVAMAVAAALVYPGITTLYNGTDPVTFFGLPIKLISYPTSVIPIVVAVFAQSRLEKVLKPRLPQLIRGIFLPLISIVVTALLTFIVIGPVTNIVSTALANGIMWLLNACPPVAGAIFGLIYPVMIIFGLHWGLLPITLNNLSTLGADPILAVTLATNFAIAGASFAIFLKTKNSQLKQVSGSAFISALIGGITEPAIYGAVLKFKRPFIIVCIVDAIGGVIIACTGAAQTSFLSTCLLTVPAFMGMMGIVALIVVCIGFFGGAILTYLFGFNDKMLEEK